MFIDDQTFTRSGRTYRRTLLRTSYRSNGRVLHNTIANLSHCKDEEIEAVKWALENKSSLKKTETFTKTLDMRQGSSVGATWVLYKLAERLGIKKALGNDRNGKLALLMVLASIIGRNSRLSIVRSADQYAFCDILGLNAFDEDDLYSAMDWLCENQENIETRLFRQKYSKTKPVLYLYDVTSSYLEGNKNELGAYGYNRDGKKGKKQIVIGLLTDEEGFPISVQVFKGNTADSSTFNEQIQKLQKQFGVERLVAVGDRGMIKSVQINKLIEENLNFITAVTKAQIGSLLKQGVIQMEMFDEELMEAENEGIRYVLKRNPVRAKQIERNRREKLASIQKLVTEQNQYLLEHDRAGVETALKKVNEKIEKLKITGWLSVSVANRSLELEIDESAHLAAARLDGCYVIKTDLKKEDASKETVHDRYKSLAQVERAFRSMKSPFLELRGIYVRKEERTRAHVFIVMLAYQLTFHLSRYWQYQELTVEEGVKELASICSMKVSYAGKAEFQSIPQARERGRQLLQAIDIMLPEAIPSRNVKVVTRKKLVSERKNANTP